MKVSTAVSIGNRAVVDEVMLLGYFSKIDKETTNIAFYLEGFKEGKARDFLRLAKESEDTIITFFGGKTSEEKLPRFNHNTSFIQSTTLINFLLFFFYFFYKSLPLSLFEFSF